MRARISYIQDRLRNSFWFTPAVMMLVAVLLSIFTLSFDGYVGNDDLKKIPGVYTLVYSGGPDGAREVLSTIAGSMITVAGVVFSITIVALTLASNQFGPRMLDKFMRDRGNQVTLGTFVATFLYSLLVLRTISTDDPSSVPDVSVTVALAMAISAMAVLIYFIHHVSVTIQAPNLVAVIGNELKAGVGHLFPDVTGLNHAQEPAEDHVPNWLGEGREVEALGSGYVQVVDLDGLVELARKHDLVIRLEVRPGRFVVPTTVIARAWPAGRVTEEMALDIAGQAVTGARRTVVQDVEFPIRQLAEVAVRSLGPGMNDPFTAATCVDHVSVGLCDAAEREFPVPALADEDGTLRLVVGDPLTFERLIGAAFDPVRQVAKGHAIVYIHMIDALTRIAACARSPERLEPLLAEARLVVEAAEEAVEYEVDRAVVKQRYDALVAVATARRT